MADASVIISLNATGCAEEILRALPNRLMVVDVVPSELDTGRMRGRRDADRLSELVRTGLVGIVTLDDTAATYFEELVVGPANQTLDDGEAATIAYAIAHRAFAVIDERKANRLCVERFPTLPVVCTTDIFSHPDIIRYLGKEKLTEAVVNALQLGRMRVIPRHLEWVVGIIGLERAALCRSLPRSARVTQEAPTI